MKLRMTVYGLGLGLVIGVGLLLQGRSLFAGNAQMQLAPQDQSLYLPLIYVGYPRPLPQLVAYALLPAHPRLYPSDSFKVHYYIDNPTRDTLTLYLLARVRSPYGQYLLLETANGSGVRAVAVQVTPGVHWYERDAVIPENVPSGTYGMTWLISSSENVSDAVDAESAFDALSVLPDYP